MQVQLLKYCDKQFRLLNDNLFSFTSKCSMDSVHRLRLNLKKVKIVLKVVDYKQTVEKKDNAVKIINDIFKISGFLRDIQIQIKLFKSYKVRSNNERDVTQISVLLSKEQTIAENSLIRLISKLNPFDLILLNQRVDCFIESFDDQSITHALMIKLDMISQYIKQLVNEVPIDRNLHRIRIAMKENIYLLTIFQKGVDKNQRDSSLIEKLDALQTGLGNWHDLKLLYEKIAIENLQEPELKYFIKTDLQRIQKELIIELNSFK